MFWAVIEQILRNDELYNTLFNHQANQECNYYTIAQLKSFKNTLPSPVFPAIDRSCMPLQQIYILLKEFHNYSQINKHTVSVNIKEIYKLYKGRHV